MAEVGTAGETPGEEQTAQAVETRKRYHGRSIGKVPGCVGMEAGRPRLELSLARDTQNDKKSFYRYVS